MRSKKFIAALTAVALTFSAMTFTVAADESASETGETSTSETTVTSGNDTSTSETTAPASESSSDDTTTSATTAPASESGSEDGTTTSVTGDDTTTSETTPSESTPGWWDVTDDGYIIVPDGNRYEWEHEDFENLPGDVISGDSEGSGIQWKRNGNDIYAYSAGGSTGSDTIRFKLNSTADINQVLEMVGLSCVCDMGEEEKIRIKVSLPVQIILEDGTEVKLDELRDKYEFGYNSNMTGFVARASDGLSLKPDGEFVITIDNLPAGAYINFMGMASYVTIENTETEPETTETTETTAPAATAPSGLPTAPAVTAAATTAAAETASVIPASSTEEAVSAISEAAANSTVTLSLEGNSTTVSRDILSAAAGKDVEVKFELNNGVSWSINGQDITDAADIDLGITLDTKTVPEEQAQTVAAGNDTFQFSLDHDGEFGFKAVLNIPVEEKYNGKYAYLYWFHDDKFDYIGSSEVKNGSTALVMDHASDYIMVFGEAEDYNVNVAAGMTALEREIASANTKTTVPAIPAGIAVVTAALGVSALILKKKSSK